MLEILMRVFEGDPHPFTNLISTTLHLYSDFCCRYKLISWPLVEPVFGVCANVATYWNNNTLFMCGKQGGHCISYATDAILCLYILKYGALSPNRQ